MSKQLPRFVKRTVKFMQVLSWDIFFELRKIAKQRGVTVQELLRVMVIPEWLDAVRRDEQDKRREMRERLQRRRRRERLRKR